MKGGSNIPASKRLKFMFLKKGCLLTSEAPSSWQPNLCFASLVSSCDERAGEGHAWWAFPPAEGHKELGASSTVAVSFTSAPPAASAVATPAQAPSVVSHWRWAWVPGACGTAGVPSALPKVACPSLQASLARLLNS